MNGPLYVRVRGQVQGPHDLEQLRVLVRRGQLSRVHELSPDGLTWSRASTFPELFAPTNSDLKGANAEPATAAATVSGPAAAPWYYSTAGKEHGPVEFATLQSLVASGQLGASDLVWSQGMASWTLADQVPGLIPAPPMAIVTHGNSPAEFAIATGASGDHEVSAGLCQAAESARPWVLFLATTLFIFAGLSVVGGLIFVTAGAKARNPIETAGGLFSVIYGVLFGFGGWQLIVYARHLAALGYTRKASSLEAALASLKTFWVFVSIVLIVLLAFIAVIVIWVVSIGSSFGDTATFTHGH